MGRLLGARLAMPLDGGCVLNDGERLLGSHKTWRGLASGIIASTLIARLWGLSWWVGAVFGLCALTGDALSSALKRRLHRPPGAGTPMIDQLPEALLPLSVLAQPLQLDLPGGAAAVTVFALLDLIGTSIHGASLGRRKYV
jgi:hypothetical protein